MISKKLDLTSVVVSSYDQTKTTIQGRAFSKTIDSKTVLGAPLPTFYDVQTDFTGALIPGVGVHRTANNRLFVMTAITTGVASIAMYSLDAATGAETIVGKITVTFANLAATTQTVRGFKVIDTGTAGWKIGISTTGSVLINGGLYLVNKVDLADFTSLGTAFGFATASDAKGVYFLHDPANIGVGQLNSASTGLIIDAANTDFLVHNGIAATHQYYFYDYAAAPTYVPVAVTVNVASPGIVTDAGHTFLANDPVVFTAGTLPTGLVVGTVYFVRNPVASTSYELSATSGGASINTTGSPSSGAFIGRAFGTTGSNFVHKTGNLPALTGTLILINSESYAMPAHGTNTGTSCAFFATTTNLYVGQISELTSGAVTWPSLATANILGATNEITAPTLVQASWSNTLDCAVYTTSVSQFIAKQLVNNVIRHKFGAVLNTYVEGLAPTVATPIPFGAITVVGMECDEGWVYLSGSTAGQRGVFALDLRSDNFYDYSFIVTKVLSTPKTLQYNFLAPLVKLQADAKRAKLQYRTSGFGVITGGWTDIATQDDLSLIAVAEQVQFKILFDIAETVNVTSPQLSELVLGLTLLNELSDSWVGSHPNTSSVTPAKSAFRLIKAYASVVPTMYFRAYDDSGVLVASANTASNPTSFEYSSNNGSSWNALGTIPNTINTTELRYGWTVDPGINVTVSLSES